jgi:hypothetical protein
LPHRLYTGSGSGGCSDIEAGIPAAVQAALDKRDFRRV